MQVPMEGSINQIPTVVKKLAQKVGTLPLSEGEGPVLETVVLVLIKPEPSITS